MYLATLLLAIHDCKVQILTGLPLGFLPEFVGFATVVLGFFIFRSFRPSRLTLLRN